ncbi:MAG TPA: response regulator [Saprospiraceae bacterium]|nr:response regulator [Saprospiraceae bacterium]
MKNSAPITTLVIDDHPGVWVHIDSYLKKSKYLKFDVIKKGASSFNEALDLLEKHSIKLVTIDYDLEESRSGVDLVRKIREQYPHIKIVFHTGLSKPFDKHKALEAGAHGYTLKSDSSEDILSVIHAVMKNELEVLLVEGPPSEQKLLRSYFNGSKETKIQYRIIDEDIENPKRVLEILGSEMFWIDLVVVEEMLLDGSSGIDLIRQIRINYPNLKIIFHNSSDKDIYKKKAEEAGANECVSVNTPKEEVILSVENELGSMFDSVKKPKEIYLPVSELEYSEEEVLEQIAKGKSQKRIADYLYENKIIEEFFNLDNNLIFNFWNSNPAIEYWTNKVENEQGKEEEGITENKRNARIFRRAIRAAGFYFRSEKDIFDNRPLLIHKIINELTCELKDSIDKKTINTTGYLTNQLKLIKLFANLNIFLETQENKEIKILRENYLIGEYYLSSVNSSTELFRKFCNQNSHEEFPNIKKFDKVFLKNKTSKKAKIIFVRAIRDVGYVYDDTFKKQESVIDGFNQSKPSTTNKWNPLLDFGNAFTGQEDKINQALFSEINYWIIKRFEDLGAKLSELESQARENYQCREVKKETKILNQTKFLNQIKKDEFFDGLNDKDIEVIIDLFKVKRGDSEYRTVTEKFRKCLSEIGLEDHNELCYWAIKHYGLPNYSLRKQEPTAKEKKQSHLQVPLHIVFLEEEPECYKYLSKHLNYNSRFLVTTKDKIFDDIQCLLKEHPNDPLVIIELNYESSSDMVEQIKNQCPLSQIYYLNFLEVRNIH